MNNYICYIQNTQGDRECVSKNHNKILKYELNRIITLQRNYIQSYYLYKDNFICFKAIMFPFKQV